MMRRKGIFVLEMVFINGDKAAQGEVVVDSGTADNVMPNGILDNITIREPEAGSKFVAAAGVEVGNYGRKDVQFIPLQFWEETVGSPFQGRA